jgi:hypothetical protein
MAFTGVANAASFTLSFGSKFVDRKVMDMDPVGPSLGDYVPGNGIIFDVKKQQLGTFNVLSTVTTLTSNSVIRWVNNKYQFGDGTDSINIQGAEEFETATGLPVQGHVLHYAIAGGTGKYAGARGACVVARVSDTDFTTICKGTTMKMTFPNPTALGWGK